MNFTNISHCTYFERIYTYAVIYINICISMYEKKKNIYIYINFKITYVIKHECQSLIQLPSIIIQAAIKISFVN